MGKVKDIIAKDTLYLIVIKEVWDRIVKGTKTIEYREVTDYWTRRIHNKPYKYLRITNGYGNYTLDISSLFIPNTTVVNGEIDFSGLQFDQPGDYVIAVTPTSNDVEGTEFSISIAPEEEIIAQDDSRGEEGKKPEGDRPIIAQINKPEVELKTEILDSQGNPIFHYPIPNYNKDLPAQRVGIEVYNDTAKGTGFLYVLGELDPTKIDVPQEFQGVYNVRFTAPIVIDTEARNSQPIKFFGDPTISVTENVKGVIKRGGGFAGETTNNVSGSFIVNVQEFNLPSSPPNNDSTFDDSTENNENILADTSQFEKVGNSQKAYANKFKNLGEGTSPGGVPIDIDKQNVPNGGTIRNVTYALQSLNAGTNNSANKLSGMMKGAELRITNPHNLVDSTLYPDAQWEKPTSFTSSIVNIINDTSFELLENYQIRTRKGIPATRIVPLQASASQYKIIYKGVTEPTEDTIIKKSFANITVGNLRTFSGDTYKSKIYMKEEGSSGGFEKIYDVVVESPNQLVDKNSITGFKNVGSFCRRLASAHEYWSERRPWRKSNKSSMVWTRNEFAFCLGYQND